MRNIKQGCRVRGARVLKRLCAVIIVAEHSAEGLKSWSLYSSVTRAFAKSLLVLHPIGVVVELTGVWLYSKPFRRAWLKSWSSLWNPTKKVTWFTTHNCRLSGMLLDYPSNHIQNMDRQDKQIPTQPAGYVFSHKSNKCGLASRRSN